LPVGRAQDSVSELLARLANGPFNKSTLYSLEGQPPDPRTMPALESAFDHSKTTEEKQWIAATLLRLGEGSRAYFDYLAGHAKEAIEDSTPFFVRRRLRTARRSLLSMTALATPSKASLTLAS